MAALAERLAAERQRRNQRGGGGGSDLGRRIASVREQRSAPPADLSMGDVGRGAFENLPESTMQLASDVVQPILHPVDTAEAMGGLAGDVTAMLGGHDVETPHFDAVKDAAIERYGGWEEVKRTMANDPAGFIADIATLPWAGSRVATSAGRVARAAKPKPQTRKEFVESAPSTADLKGEGSALYKEADAIGVAIPKHEFNRFLRGLRSRMGDEGIDPVLHPKAARVVELAMKSENTAPDLTKMQNMRRHFALAARSAEPDERRIAQIAMDSLDDFMESSAGKTAGVLGEARKTWAKMRKSELIEETVEKASTRASGFESGLRNEFSKLYRDKKRMRGFSAAERKAIEDISKGNFTRNALRRIGGLSPGEGQRRNMLNTLMAVAGGAGAGTAAGGPLGGVAGAVLAPAVGAGAQRLAQRGTLEAANVARAAVASGRAPPAQVARAAWLGPAAGRGTTAALAGFHAGRDGEAEGGAYQPDQEDPPEDEIRVGPDGTRYRYDPATGGGVAIN